MEYVGVDEGVRTIVDLQGAALVIVEVVGDEGGAALRPKATLRKAATNNTTFDKIGTSDEGCGGNGHIGGAAGPNVDLDVAADLLWHRGHHLVDILLLEHNAPCVGEDEVSLESSVGLTNDVHGGVSVLLERVEFEGVAAPFDNNAKGLAANEVVSGE